MVLIYNECEMKFVILFVLLCFNSCVFAEEDTASIKENVWENWDSPEGIARLQRSEAKENLWKLLRFYEAQSRPTYCSVATTVIAFNALSIEAPESKFLGKYRLFTQEEFFSDNVLAAIDRNEVQKRGMSLDDLTTVLGTFPVKVSKYEAQELSQEEVLRSIVSALENPNQVVLALYQRREVNQEGGGHWSPIAAYDSESDSFLILDVARFKYPPVWMNASKFINSMQTVNNNNKSRGFIIIEKPSEE